jgi:hypothetical protein
LPLVTGGGEGGGGAMPFIEIPTARSDVGEGGEQESTTSGNTTAANPTATRQTPLNPVAGQ